MTRRLYSDEPHDVRAYQKGFDRTYTRIARVYDIAVRVLPIWKTWLKRALPHIRGHRVLEVSFGTGYLMTHYAGQFDVFGFSVFRAHEALQVQIAQHGKIQIDLLAYVAQALGSAGKIPQRVGEIVHFMADVQNGFADVVEDVGGQLSGERQALQAD